MKHLKMKHLKIFEAFNVNKLFKQFVLSHEPFLVTFKPYVGEDSEEDDEFTHSYNLYDIKDTDLDLEGVKYIIVGNFFCAEDNSQEFYVIDKHNTIREATEAEDEAFREYEDDGNYFFRDGRISNF